jgi:DNA helicase-2/ATP-dependent DNA helicase PcrA
LSKVNIILGPPGTGKTTRLLNLVDEYLSKGTPPNKIAFISFTKRATEEARDRAMKRFKFGKDDLEYFRTIHSLAFKQLGLATGSVIKWSHYKEFGHGIGIEITGKQNTEDGTLAALSKGDRLIFIEQLARLQVRPLKEVWEASDSDDISYGELEQVARAFAKYKKVNGLIDYTDMLTRFYESGYVPRFDVVIIDEAQDLSQLQWKIVQRLIDQSDTAFIAGDDDQAIFRWSGADIEHFIGLQGSVTVLEQSYRLPKAVHALATGITKDIVNRREKRFNSREFPGYIQYLNYIEDLDLTTGHWLLLARNTYLVKNLVEECKNLGVFYSFREAGMDKSDALLAARCWERLRKGGTESTGEIKNTISHMKQKCKPSDLKIQETWSLADLVKLGFTSGSKPWFEALDAMRVDDSEYIKGMLRRGEKLQEPPRIRISTIHGAKGAEADNVALFTDMSYRTFQGMQKNPDDEARVFYVGVTRAREQLCIMNPRTDKFYQL